MKTLAEVIATIESANNQYALRFEPMMYERQVSSGVGSSPLLSVIKIANRCSLHTARMIYCTSWGAFQFMGFNLYDLGLSVSVGSFLNSPEVQLALFHRFVDKNKINFTVEQLATDEKKRREFATRYNGPGNVEVYGARILEALQKV